MEGLRWFPAAFPSPGFQKLETRNPWRSVLVETENNFLGSVLKENLIFFRRNPPECVVAPLSQWPGKSLASFDSISAQVLPFLFYTMSPISRTAVLTILADQGLTFIFCLASSPQTQQGDRSSQILRTPVRVNIAAQQTLPCAEIFGKLFSLSGCQLLK